MLQGKALASAIVTAMELKAERDGVPKITQAALGAALGITQPSVSELLKFGRLAKENLPRLLDFFADVVGPDHFGLPISKFEMEFLKQLRELPSSSQRALFDRVARAASDVSAATKELDVPPQDESGKRTGTAG